MRARFAFTMLAIALLVLVPCSCTIPYGPKFPRPSKKLTLEKAQRLVERHNTPDRLNRRYYRAYPR